MYEAKTNLARLVDAASKGEVITITKHGHPVAVLSAAPGKREVPVTSVIDDIREMRKGVTLAPLRLRDIIDQGRT